jgi:hypothetical protein
MKVIPFEILKESWSAWKMPDGILLRLRAQLVWALETDSASGEGSVKTAMAIGTITPESMHGTPTASGPDIRNHKPVRVYSSKEWEIRENGQSIYRLESGTILELSLMLQTVSRYDIFDKAGEPVIQAGSLTQVLLQGSVSRPGDQFAGAGETLFGRLSGEPERAQNLARRPKRAPSARQGR